MNEKLSKACYSLKKQEIIHCYRQRDSKSNSLTKILAKIMTNSETRQSQQYLRLVQKVKFYESTRQNFSMY